MNTGLKALLFKGPRCLGCTGLPALAEALWKAGVETETIDVSTPGGLLNAQHYRVMNVPRVLLVNAAGAALADWQCVPDVEAVLEEIRQREGGA